MLSSKSQSLCLLLGKWELSNSRAAGYLEDIAHNCSCADCAVNANPSLFHTRGRRGAGELGYQACPDSRRLFEDAHNIGNTDPLSVLRFFILALLTSEAT